MEEKIDEHDENESVYEGSFYVSKPAIDAMIDAKSSAKQICCYLVLARFTDRTGVFSSAGKSSINKYLDISSGAATSSIDRLQQISISMPQEKFIQKYNGKLSLPREIIVDPKLMQRKFQKSQYLIYALNDFGVRADYKVWFPNCLIDNTGKFSNPLERLLNKGNSDKAARALLLMYQNQDMQQSGGVKPHTIGFRRYEVESSMTLNNYTVAKVKASSEFRPTDAFMAGVCGGTDSASVKDLTETLKMLENNGFIYRAIVAFDNDPGDCESEALYCIDTKSGCDYKDETDLTLVGELDELLSALGQKVTDNLNRHYDRYTVIMPTERAINVAEIYRLRFRVQNHSIKSIELLEDRTQKRYQDTLQWINEAIKPAEPVLKIDEYDANSGYVEGILADAVSSDCYGLYGEITF